MIPLPYRSVVGCVLYLLTYIALLKHEYRIWPIGRAATAVSAAAAFVIAGVIDPAEATQAVDLSTLVVLAGLMVQVGLLQRHGCMALVERWILPNGASTFNSLGRLTVVAAVGAALLTNDATCVLLTPIVSRMINSGALPAAPALLVLATASNIGSAASPLGSPQAIAIVIHAHIPAWQVLCGIGVAVLTGLAVNMGVVWIMCRGELRARLPGPASEASALVPPDVELPVAVVLASSAMPPRLRARAYSADEASAAARGKAVLRSGVRTGPLDVLLAGSLGTKVVQPPLQVQPTSAHAKRLRPGLIGALFLCNVPAIIAAQWWTSLSFWVLLISAVMVAVDRQRDGTALKAIDGQALAYFVGLFIITRGLVLTQLPERLWTAMLPAIARANVNLWHAWTLSCLLVLCSNVLGNVPTTLLLISLQPVASTSVWLQALWATTIAGNLTLLGSVANILVSERAARMTGFHLTFLKYLRVGLPSTVLMVLVGTPTVMLCARIVAPGE